MISRQQTWKICKAGISSFAVVRADEEGIARGTTTTAFNPNDPCTRAQIVTFPCRGIPPVLMQPSKERLLFSRRSFFRFLSELLQRLFRRGRRETEPFRHYLYMAIISSIPEPISCHPSLLMVHVSSLASTIMKGMMNPGIKKTIGALYSCISCKFGSLSSNL